MIKFMKFYVTDGENKAKVHYSTSVMLDGKACVTLYARDYGHCLGRMFPENYQNDTDSMTDYFEKGRVRISQDNQHYAQALARCKA